MNPAFLDNMSWEMAEVYGAITDQILINLSRYFRYYKPGDKIPRTAFEYQAQMLAQMGKVNRDTVRIIRNGLADADEALKSTLEQAIIDSVSKSQPELLKGVKAGILAPQGVPIVAPNQMRAFELYYKQSADRLNLVNTVMLESTKSAYQQTVSDVVSEIMLSDRVAATYGSLDVATGEVVTGVSSWNTALRHATDRLKNRGITGFVDHAGRQWSAESYVAMDIRTTAFNTGRAAVWEQNQNFGNDLYLVSYHNGARPGCYDWQNKVISSLNISRDVTDLDGNTIHVYAQSDTTYGQPAGLFGINCKHYPSPFIPGVSLIRGEPQSPEENEKTYMESQEQRRLERKLREEKRDLLIAKEQGASPEELAKLRNKARNTSQDIDDFCEQTGRARHRDREAVYTKREFPDKERYDVSEFKHEQQNAINKYFKDGVAQREFTAGQMTQKEPITPKQPAPVAPVVPSAPVAPVDQLETNGEMFTPAKTRAEAEEYARKHFADNVDFSGMSIENANKVNETLTELTHDYPIDRLDHITQKPIGAVARARHDELEINGKKLGKTLNDEEINFKLNQAFVRHEKEMLYDRYKGKAKLPFDAENKIKKLENELRFTRYGVHSSHEDHVRAVVAHEYGHIVSDQYFGMINEERANPNYSTNWSLRVMCDRWRQTFEKAISTGDIYSLSQYGSKNPREFFAECFAARFMGEKLPDYVESLMIEVLKNGIM